MTGTLPPFDDLNAYGPHYKWFNNDGDNGQFPVYAVMPTKLIDANVILSPNAAVRTPQINSYPTGCKIANWTQVKDDICGFDPPPGTWAMYLRKTTFLFEGNKKVQYVGFSETGAEPTSMGACEDWWFAEGVGPIYIAKYPHDTRSGCANRIAAQRTLLNEGGRSVGAYNRPDLYLPTNKARMMGYLRLNQRCIAVCQASP